MTTQPTLTPAAFAAKWKGVTTTEKAASQEHFIDLCRMLGEPTPHEADPTGEQYAFEKRVAKAGGGDGFADVWKRDFFAWEYKGKTKSQVGTTRPSTETCGRKDGHGHRRGVTLMSAGSRRLLPATDAAEAAELMRTAVEAIAKEIREGGLTRETGITGAFVREINRVFDGALTGAGSFKARELNLSEESELGADILVVLVTTAGRKWLLLQAKVGWRISSEWKNLTDDCLDMVKHGSGRALVYYEDQFLAADARKIPTPATRPTQRRTAPGTTPPHWFPMADTFHFFFDCWGGSRRHLPRRVTSWVVVLGWTDGDTGSPAVLDAFERTVAEIEQTSDSRYRRREL